MNFIIRGWTVGVCLLFLGACQTSGVYTGAVNKGPGNTQTIPISLPDNAPSILGDYLQEGQGSHAGEGQIKSIYISQPPDNLAIAAADGTVTWASSRSVRVRHDNPPGLMTSYAPLSEALVREGDKVTRGQPVARTGKGKSPQAYWQYKLTFTVWDNETGDKANPHEYWLGGPGKIVCYDAAKTQTGSGKFVLTYPAPCVTAAK